MTKLLLFIFLLSSTCAFSQFDMSKKSIDKLVAEIASENKLLSSAIGIAGAPTKQYARFEALKEKATSAKLIALTNHKNAVVRCYAFWALADKKDKELFPILTQHLTDTAKVESTFGCVREEISVADFYINLLTKENLFVEDYIIENHSSISSEEKEKLDSIVLYTPNNLEYFEKVLWNHEPNQRDYERIREIAVSGNYIALPALGKYQKEQDLELILSFRNTPLKQNMWPHPFECLFKAIENFPHEYFLSFLDEYGKSIVNDKGYSHNWKDFYNANAKYNNEISLNILKRSVVAEGNIPMLKYHLDFISAALGKYPSKENQELIIYIWKKYKHIDKNSFEFLKERDPDQTFELVKNYLEDFEEVYDGGNEDKMIPVVLDFAISLNKAETIKLIAKNLRTNSVTPFEKFAKYAKELKSEEFIDPLFYRIENEWNGYIVDESVDIIIEFENKDLNQRIFTSLKKNKEVANEYITMTEIEEGIKDRIRKKEKK